MCSKRILFITTNIGKFPCGEPCGVRFEEFTVPYINLSEQLYEIDIASPKGGFSPIEREGMSELNRTAKLLFNTIPLDKINPSVYDAVFLPGGYGAMFDLAENKTLSEIIQDFNDNNKLIGAIGHGVAGLIGAKGTDDEPLVKDRELTAFTNFEEHIKNRHNFVPFSLELKLIQLGAKFIPGVSSRANVVIDANLITGQNTQSSELFTEKFIKYLKSH